VRLRQVPTVLGAVLLPAALAHATPFLTPHLGGPVFVGPVDAHVTSLYWNPAAAGLLQGTHYYLSGTARLDWTQVERSTISSDNGEPAGGGNVSFGTQTLTPLTVDNFVGVISDLSSSEVTVGVALYSPYSENLSSSDALAYHASGGLFYGETVGIGLAYRVEPWLIIGVSGNLLFSKYHLQFTRDKALDGCVAAPCNVEAAASAEKYDLDAPLIEFPTIDASFGFILRISDWTFGFSTANFLGAIAGTTASLVGDARVTPAGSSSPLSGKTTIGFKLPVTVDLGAKRHVFGDWDLVLGARWTHLATQNKLDLRVYGQALTAATIPDWIVRYRGLNDVYWAEVGLEEAPATKYRWGVRARFSTGGVPEEAVAIDQLDAPSVDLSGGLEWRLGERLGLTFAYTLSLLVPRDVTSSDFSPSARIACNASQYDITTAACAAVRDGRAIPTAAGKYLRIGNQLTLGVAIDLW